MENNFEQEDIGYNYEETELADQYKPLVNYKSFDAVCVADFGEKYYIAKYVTTSNFQWITGEDIKTFLPINSLTKEIISTNLNKGRDVFIQKNWGEEANEILPIHLSFDERPTLQNYLRRAISFINSFIQAPMANTNAAVIYGFNVLNNKFIENGFVFSEKNRSLKYIDIMDKVDELESSGDEENIKISDELLNDLEKYIEYRNILDRTYFIYNLKETLQDKLKELAKLNQVSPTTLYVENINTDTKLCHVDMVGSILYFNDTTNERVSIDLNDEYLKETVDREFPRPSGFGEPNDENFRFEAKFNNFKSSVNILFSDVLNTEESKNIHENAQAVTLDFMTIVSILLTKKEEYNRKTEMDKLIIEFTTRVNHLNTTI